MLRRAASIEPQWAALGGLVLLAVLFVVDWVTGPGLSMLLGYGAVAGLCGFMLPRRAGAGIAAVAVAMGAVVAIAHPDAYLSVQLAVANATLRLVFFIVIVVGAALLRETIVELDRLAHTDALSGLDNRRAFLESAEHERLVAMRRKTTIAVVAIDLDGLKQVNDLLGHEAGDAMIAQFSRALAETFRATDRVARVGGDEFAAVLPDTDLSGSTALVRRLTTCAEPIAFSCGVVWSPDPSVSIAELLRAADDAMYEAKQDASGTAVVAVELAGTDGAGPEVVEPGPA